MEHTNKINAYLVNVNHFFTYLFHYFSNFYVEEDIIMLLLKDGSYTISEKIITKIK